MGSTRCEECGNDAPGYDTVSYGSMDHGYRQLFTRCFNAEVAKRIGLEAFELQEGNPAGYQFQILGDPDEDVFEIMARMVERIRRTISRTHLVDEGHGILIAEQTVRGHIDCDRSEGDSRPLLVVDGREVSWDDFGRMLMAFEGWNFNIELFDPSDEP